MSDLAEAQRARMRADKEEGNTPDPEAARLEASTSRARSSKDQVHFLLAASCDKLEEIEDDLISLGGSASEDVVNRLFHVFHSIKGAAASAHHQSLERLTQLAENVLSEMSDGRIKSSKLLAEAMLRATACMKQMIHGGVVHEDVPYATELHSLRTILRLKTALPVEAPKPKFHRLNMLVVEDDLSSRIALQGLLTAYGTCHVAVNGKEAVQAFCLAREMGQPYDLICMDINMPEMNGQKAVEEIRALEDRGNLRAGGVKIFMITCVEDMRIIFAAFRALCDSYLLKPVDADRLEEALRSFRLIA